MEAKAEATSTMNALHHTASNDLVFTSHASITSGIKYAWQKDGNHQAVKLIPETEALAKSDPQAFRERCGDGFIGSIGFGADLNVLLHFHHLTNHDRLELSFDSKASAGVADVFSAKGSSKLKTVIDTLSERGSLDINFVQTGGMIDFIPTNLETARDKVQKLAKEEYNGPRPIFMTVVPYSEVPNWPGYNLLDTSNIRQRAVRYAIRLRSIYFEIMNIREDYYRDRASLPATSACDGKTTPDPKSEPCRGGDVASDQYYYSYRHKLRDENLSAIATKVTDTLKFVDSIMRVLNSPACNPKAVAVLASNDRAKKTAFADAMANFNKAKGDCDTETRNLIAKTHNFDDFWLSGELPIPQNSIPRAAIDLIESSSTALADKKLTYGQYVFRHWVERSDQIRCRLFSECLTPAEKIAAYNGIISTMASGTGTPVDTVPAGVFTLCSGEYDYDILNAPHGCKNSQYRLDCPHAGDSEPKAKEICEVLHGAYGHSVATSDADMRDGNFCGYRDFRVTCYNLQPRFP